MSQFRSLPPKRLIDGLKIATPAVIIVAVVFGLLRRANQTFLPVTLDFATAAAVGITAGLTTRWSLRGRTDLLRVLVAVATTINGLIILGLVTWGQAGIRMLVMRTEADWNALGQVIVGSSSAFFALRAWRRSIQVLTYPPESPEQLAPRAVARQNVTRPRRRRGRITPSANSFPPASQARVASLAGMPRVVAIPRWRAPHITLPNWQLPHLTLPRVNFRNPLRARDSLVRVNGVTEERCPYCLDEIVNNDPRGVRVCSICHSPHHADCWAMTGMCQIPHYHT